MCVRRRCVCVSRGGTRGGMHGAADLYRCQTSPSPPHAIPPIRVPDRVFCVCVMQTQYNMGFYYQYLAQWPEFFRTLENPGGGVMGYMMGKSEGEGKLWHGHVTAVTVAPQYRRLGLARELMNELEATTQNVYNGYFVDLFVRKSNALAIGMYRKFGYDVYRRVLGYYSGEEDAFGAFVCFACGVCCAVLLTSMCMCGAASTDTLVCADMRKALARDPGKESMVPLPHPITPDELEW